MWTQNPNLFKLDLCHFLCGPKYIQWKDGEIGDLLDNGWKEPTETKECYETIAQPPTLHPMQWILGSWNDTVLSIICSILFIILSIISIN